MGIVTVNYSLNQTYFVEKKVFESIVKKAGANSKLTKITTSNIEVLESKNDYRVELEVEIKKGVSFEEALFELQSEIEKYSYNIIESKPENITIVVNGSF